MLDSVGSLLKMSFLNLRFPPRDVNTILNVCYSATWLAGVTCVLHLTYKFIRDYTYMTVNCWFCSQNSRVPFRQRKEWMCSHCEQFNGFTKDGDYSKLIPEQYDERLSNKKLNLMTPDRDTLPNLNGLCRTCNANQELKIRQIASYVPLKEKEYDQEIELFREKLERSYKLCPVCERTLQSTLKFKSRLYCTESLPKKENHLEKMSFAKQDQVGKWKHLIGLLLTTVTLASLWKYAKLPEYVMEYEASREWLDILELSMLNADENYNFLVNIFTLASAGLFTKIYFGRATLLGVLFGILSFVTTNNISLAVKISSVISVLFYFVYKFMKKRNDVRSPKKSQKCYELPADDEDFESVHEDNQSLLNLDVPICGKLSGLNLGRTQSIPSPKPSYLFKPNRVLVQPPKLILEDLDESSDTVRSFRTTSSGYDSVTSFLRKSPDSVSEYDSVSQTGNKCMSRSRISPNALITYNRHRLSYSPLSERFYGVSSASKSNHSNSVLNPSESQVNAFFSTLQIFLCSLAFFILGFSSQLLLSNLTS